eukprot:CAMPEP_0185572248 /NCGR_PEP_ID=MMETSP0434-20130131/4207_1 /TAXON_ID=626734 ORGANISM="Favella taraikaensis, Strain Fe Narragansett Bay" /NCGR_SAMPLE_ID=MMETSP0434 /ASSEMBLY_ACC=CAM_ASM_000379 /LENGTH=162 /DNA_ID=CAMNT_0028188045 /DNA_START=1611 /DNA_END=2099 /DNA_ORIENTATION=-
MLERRGCMTALFHEGYIYVIGGLNYAEKCLKKCERFRFVLPDEAVGTKSQGWFDNTEALERWKKIADMREPRKNASSVSMTADTIYVFGGTSNTTQTLSSIEHYSIASNRWQLLKVQMPRALCFLSTFKLTSTQVLILGGSMRENPPPKSTDVTSGRSFMSN